MTSMAGSTPWWAVPLVAGIFGFLGVAVSQFFAIRFDRIRRSREDERRLDDDLRVASGALINALRQYVVFLRRFSIPAAENRTGVGWTETVDRLNAAVFDAATALELAAPQELLAPVNRARNVLAEMYFPALYTEGKKDMSPKSAFEYGHELAECSHDFMNLVRQHFGLKPL